MSICICFNRFLKTNERETESRGSRTFSGVYLSQSRMALRKRIEREKTKVSAESQEDDVSSDRNDVAPLVAARELRRREREQKSKNKDMTEEEMMALALQLSEHEANITAQRLEEEEEAMRKAIQDSIFDDSQDLMDAAAPPGVSSRRKLVYSNGESTTDHGEGRSPRAASNRATKYRRVEGSPLTEIPDLSQTQPSPSSSESTPLCLQSPQSCDSTQIEDCKDLQSPVLKSHSAQFQVRVHRLNQDLLDSCATSGFVLCSQDSDAPTQSSHCQKPSPTFPKIPASCPQIPASKVEAANSQMFDLGDDTQPELSQEPRTSPVFGRTDCTSALQADTAEATALSFSSQESSVTSSLDKEVSLIKSPVFSKTQVGGSDRGKCQSPVFGTTGRTMMSQGDELEEQEDEKAEEEQSLSQTEPTIDMTLHWSEEDEDSVTPVVSPSPVFPEERSLLPTVNDNEESAPSQTQHRSAAPQSGSAVSEAACSSGDSAPQSTVHYYWGVPFCPRGLDPDQYTKVIVAQMEVYEKSLKQAQRGLLNKAKWGEPILPQPEKSPSSEPNSPPPILTTRRSWRLRGRQKELESEEEAEEATEDTQRSQRSLWEEEEGDKEMKQDAGEEEEEGQQKTVLEDQREAETQGESDCEVCPETQLSDDNTQELNLPSQPLVRSLEIEMVQVDSPNVPEPQTPPTPEPEEPMVQRGPESAEEPTESTKPGDMDVEGPHCEPQSRESPQQSQSPQPDPNPDSQELSSPDLVTGPDLDSRTESPVQCPLCQQTFPSDQIEMHAAFCDGTPAAGDKAPKPRRKRMRRGETENPNHTDHEPSVALEKCYICQKLVPLRDYSLHTNRCFQRPPLRTATTGGLLSALDQSEPRDSEAGPSGSSARPHEVIDLVDDDDDEEDSVSLIKISNSPIRSFTAISEAQDCLIDFSRQHLGKRPATRLGTKQRSKRR